MNELGPEARAAVEAGRAGDEPTGRDRARIRAALMATIAGGAATAIAEGAAAAGAAKGTATAGAFALGWGWKALAVGLAVAGAIGTGIVVTRSSVDDGGLTHPSAALPPPEPPVALAPSALPPPRGPSLPEPARAPAPTSVAKAPIVPIRAPVLGSPRAPAPSPPDPLAGEMGALRDAHGALQGGDPARALALLDAQSTTYADGQLREEREAARVTALCKLGKKDEARAAAARFLSESPRSVLANRVRNACPDDAPR